MPNYQLLNTNVDTIPIVAQDAAGDVVGLPSDLTPTVVNSDPASLEALIQGSNLVMRCLVPTFTGVSLEIDDGSLTPFTIVVDGVEDMTPTAVGLNLLAVTHTSQPRPVAATPPAPTEPPVDPAAPTA